MKSVFITAIGVLLLTVGCQTQPEFHGRSEYSILPSHLPANNAPPSDAEIEYNPGYPKGKLATPVYPARALAAHVGKYVIYVTLTIDESGHVVSVTRSVRDINLPGSFAADFFAAVRDAVLNWHFIPAHNIYWEHGPDNEMRYIRAEPVSRTMDVKFTFEASGVVR